jgi:uncharacterized protein YuzE
MKVHYRFEVLDSAVLYYEYRGPERAVVEHLTNEETVHFEFELKAQLLEEFDNEIQVTIDMNQKILGLELNDNVIYHDMWEGFAFRAKGIQVTDTFHMRLTEII